VLKSDLLQVLAAAASGDLGGSELEFASRAAVTVVLAAEQYPEAGVRGGEITGVEDAEGTGAMVFHAGTALHGERLMTNGGRILAVTGVGPNVADARAAAYEAVASIEFPGMRYRKDIAAAAAAGMTLNVSVGPRS
jgi:phosphoribosylamine--glycine ligase